MEDSDHILEVSNLGVKIQNQTILENISFTFRRGTILAIVGPNGAGKTILLKAILNLVPYYGNINWTGKVKIGYLPQNLSPGDIPISVQEFMTFKAVGLDDEDIAKKRLGALSGGQLQRVLIAWAIIDRPQVLLSSYTAQPPGPLVALVGVIIFVATAIARWMSESPS